MFKPTHLVHIRDPDGIRVIALQRTYVSEEIEVFRDCANAEFVQDAFGGVTGWPEYQIRLLADREQLPSGSVRPVGPPASAPYRPAGLRSYISEPAMLSC